MVKIRPIGEIEANLREKRRMLDEFDAIPLSARCRLEGQIEALEFVLMLTDKEY